MAYLVGRGLSDITGEPADCGMLGYGKSTQRTTGLHTRLRSRAFVFADADDPQRWLGTSLRTQEEVDLMAQLGEAYGAVQDAIGPTAPDETYLDDQDWPKVLAAAARLAQVMVHNDLRAAATDAETVSTTTAASNDPRDRP